MNTTITVETDPRPYILIPGLISSTILLIAMIVFLVHYYDRYAPGATNFTKITPVGQVLLGAYSGMASLFAFQLAQVYTDVYSLSSKACNVMVAFCLASIELCSIRYFWLISSTIVDMITPELFSRVEKVVTWVPFSFYIQFVAAIIFNIYHTPEYDAFPLFIIYHISMAVPGSLTVLLNSFFLYVFYQYLKRTQDHEHLHSDAKLITISKYGIVISGVSYFSSSLYMLALVLHNSEFWLNLLISLNLFFVHTTGWVSFVMKVSVWRIEDEKKAVGNNPEIQLLRQKSIAKSLDYRRNSQLAEEMW
ncbi:hypothetical protein BCR33DRAFT_713356 [Rhizoclosmatium globosum]|uniref:Uncharacterized protein n=1 Tax=Rhizoclosmatium globosum TaxID=329046 RepID=A0A1Y2CU84_9FUNG|nr:hypothetical protein BCR33DRAFT_713356 [Rhizoclosmatium globosum]|eukprot:ORY50591.1 hypothetical protein BCR33DRAFT_713356 [Rhizoclosmatium globosum]